MTRRKKTQCGQNVGALEHRKNRQPWTKSGLYMDFDIDAIDKRTSLGKTIKLLKKSLRDYVQDANVAVEMLIPQIIYRWIKCRLYEVAQLKALAENPGKIFDKEAKKPQKQAKGKQEIKV